MTFVRSFVCLLCCCCCVLLLCVVVVVCCFLTRSSVGKFLSTSHWHELAGPQLRRGGRKMRTERRKKNVRNHATQPRETRKSMFSVSQCEPRKQNCNQKHTCPFKPNGEETLQVPSPSQRRKCVKYVRSQRSTDAEHVSTV